MLPLHHWTGILEIDCKGSGFSVTDQIFALFFAYKTQNRLFLAGKPQHANHKLKNVRPSKKTSVRLFVCLKNVCPSVRLSKKTSVRLLVCLKKHLSVCLKNVCSSVRMSKKHLFVDVLCFLLSGSHASLNDVDDIVSEFFAFVDKVHVDCSDGVGIFVVVDVVDVL